MICDPRFVLFVCSIGKFTFDFSNLKKNSSNSSVVRKSAHVLCKSLILHLNHFLHLAFLCQRLFDFSTAQSYGRRPRKSTRELGNLSTHLSVPVILENSPLARGTELQS